MFCMYCGTQLPDEAAFCFKCGKKVGSAMNNPTVGMVSASQNVIPERVETGVFSSVRSQKLLYVNGHGLYFLADWGLGFYSERTKRVKKLKKKEDESGLCGLAQYENDIYYWTEPYSDNKRLYKVNYELDRRKIVFKDTKCNLFMGHNNEHVVFRGDYYYFIRPSDNQLLRFSLETKEIEKKDLPDMRTIPLPPDWEEGKHYLVLDEEAVNYGNHWEYLKIVGNRGFVGIEGLADHMISFDLENPADFEYMKKGTISPIGELQLMTTIGNHDREIFSTTEEGFYCLQFDEEGHLLTTRSIVDKNSYENAKIYKSGNWFVSNGLICFIGSFGANGFMYKNGKKPCLLKGKSYEEISDVKDFIDIPSLGKTYILTNQRLLELSYKDNIVSIVENDLFSEYVVAEWED